MYRPPPPRLRLNPPRSGQSKNVAVFGGIGVYSLSCFDMLRLQLNFGGGSGGVGGEGVPMFGGTIGVALAHPLSSENNL